MIYGKWYFFITTIYRRTRCINEPIHITLPAKLNYVQKSNQIGIRVCIRIFDAIAHSCLSSKIDYFFGLKS